jgi:cytochrome c oxidase subunit 4
MATSAPETSPSPHSEKHKRPNYLGIWIALGVLTGFELTIAFLPWHKTTLILLLIALAVWKALLVALYYMHLRFERSRLRILAIAPLPFCIIFVTAVLQEHFR